MKSLFFDQCPWQTVQQSENAGSVNGHSKVATTLELKTSVERGSGTSLTSLGGRKT